MQWVSKSFPKVNLKAETEPNKLKTGRAEIPARWRVWIQVIGAYALIEAALWTRPGGWNVFWMAAASLAILLMVLGGPYSAREMGIALPPVKGSLWILLGGLALAATIPELSKLLGTDQGPVHSLPFHAAWHYGVWALEQQFILESFFYLRFESLLGPRAVPATAVLFAVVHIPNPVLVGLGFLGGLFFCEMFRRYRNLFPLGVVHAALGLTIAGSFADAVLHHMRVGIGYLMFRP
jgi:Type II CAAX prenyl endopeptidase Rce1-like